MLKTKNSPIRFLQKAGCFCLKTPRRPMEFGAIAPLKNAKYAENR